MKTLEKHGHIVCYSKFKFEHCLELRDYLESDFFSSLCKKLNSKAIIVLGGDGTMLNAIKEHYNLKLPFLGINFGNKGFLLNSKDYVKENSGFKKVSYPLTEVKVDYSGKKYRDVFVNEVNIASVHGKMIDLSLLINSKQKINIKGDGIIISSALGSTGYNSSLGGPIIPHNLKASVITPKAAWLPRGMSSIIIPESDKVSISNVGRYSEGEVFLDGNKLVSIDECSNIKIYKSQHTFELLIEKEYKDTWDNKVLYEQGFE